MNTYEGRKDPGKERTGLSRRTSWFGKFRHVRTELLHLEEQLNSSIKEINKSLEMILPGQISNVD